MIEGQTISGFPTKRILALNMLRELAKQYPHLPLTLIVSLARDMPKHPNQAHIDENFLKQLVALSHELENQCSPQSNASSGEPPSVPSPPPSSSSSASSSDILELQSRLDRMQDRINTLEYSVNA